MKDKNLVEVIVVLLAETDKAIQVQLDEDSDRVWIPRSQIEIYESSDPNG